MDRQRKPRHWRRYHRELDGLLIVAGDTPPQVPLEEAIASLCWSVEQFDFQSEGDRSRALAAFLTPALRLGGFLRGNIPIDVAEADQSQAGNPHPECGDRADVSHGPGGASQYVPMLQREFAQAGKPAPPLF
jgi:hypothetical protein